MDKKQNSTNKKDLLSYEEKFEIMYKYLVENNALKTGIKSRTKFGEYPIGQWQARMRTEYYKGELELDSELEEKLLNLGILRKEKQRQNAKTLSWDEKFAIMEDYLKSGQSIEYGTIYKGYKLGQWQTVLRHLFYTDSLSTVSPELKKKFLEAGILKKEKGTHINHGPVKTTYDKKFEIMYKYLLENNFEQTIHQDTIFEGHTIGVWQDNLRQTYRKGRDLAISPELIDKLFTYGILKEEDKNKRQSRITRKKANTNTSSNKNAEISEMVELLLRKQEERKALDVEISNLQKLIDAKTYNEKEI